MLTAEPGIRALGLASATTEAALRNLGRWLTDEAFLSYRGAIEALIAGGRFDELADSFRQVVPFGTGGRRGSVGVGPNRINPWTIGTSVEGHVRWLRKRFPGRELSIVIAWDTRQFQDLGRLFPSDLESPIRGLTSRDLGELAARIYARHGVVSFLLPRDSTARVSTPELSWSIREYQASGGLNLSASHNPPDDNGVKVYDERGAQLVPPDDERLLDEVAAVEQAAALSWDDAVSQGWIRFLDPRIHAGYVAGVAELASPGPRRLRVVFTPLHGTGCVDEVLRAAGFDAERLAEQATPDGGFSTVPGRLPNPERPEALALAIARAEATGAALVLATDPDADRIGCAVRLPDGSWRALTGNEIAALVIDHALTRPCARRPLVVKTEVTSTLVSRVAEAAGAAVVGDLLVGFKFVADGLRALEEEGQWAGWSASEVVFVAGCEESHGVLVTPRMRDKDASGGGLFLAEAADRLARDGLTLVDRLTALAQRHGHIDNTQLNIAFPGASGQADMIARVDRMVAAPPAEVAGRLVVRVTDHRDTAGRYGPIRSNSDRAARTVVVLTLAGAGDDGARVILRPSGTEPKLKIYVERIGTPGEPADPAGWALLLSSVRALVAA